MVTNQATRKPTGIEQAVSSILGDAGLIGTDWSLRQCNRVDSRTVSLSLGPAAGKHVLLKWTEHGGEEINAFLKGSVYAVAYSNGPGAWDLDDSETPKEVKELAVRSCKVLTGLVEPIEVTDNDDQIGTSDSHTVELSANSFRDWLGAELQIDQVLVDKWMLSQIYPRGHEELVLSFRHPEEKVQPRIRVRLRDDSRPAVFRTKGLDITYRGNKEEVLQAGRKEYELRISAELVLTLSKLEGEHTSFKGRPGQDGVDLALTESKAPRALNLAIPAPCGIDCTFCSLKEELQLVHDPNSAFVESLKEDIRRAGARGTRLLRINGVEPLNAPYLLDLLAVAQECGFDEYSLHSTCLPFAEGDLAERFISVMPARYRIYVPIYGATATIHDALTGAPGSFKRLMKAVAKIRSHVSEGGQVIFTTILTSKNKEQVTAMRDLVRPLGDWWEVHLAFPNTSSATDKYRDVAISMSEALRVLYPKDWWPVADLPWGEVLPCVAYRHQQESGHELLSLKRFNERVKEPAGTFYGSAGFDHSLGSERADAFTAATVPCPHRASCSLKDACPAKVYALYEEKFGLEELSPITQETLDGMPEGPCLSREVAKIQR